MFWSDADLFSNLFALFLLPSIWVYIDFPLPSPGALFHDLEMDKRSRTANLCVFKNSDIIKAILCIIEYVNGIVPERISSINLHLLVLKIYKFNRMISCIMSVAHFTACGRLLHSPTATTSDPAVKHVSLCKIESSFSRQKILTISWLQFYTDFGFIQKKIDCCKIFPALRGDHCFRILKKKGPILRSDFGVSTWDLVIQGKNSDLITLLLACLLNQP